jgi:hypothetical protein
MHKVQVTRHRKSGMNPQNGKSYKVQVLKFKQ